METGMKSRFRTISGACAEVRGAILRAGGWIAKTGCPVLANRKARRDVFPPEDEGLLRRLSSSLLSFLVQAAVFLAQAAVFLAQAAVSVSLLEAMHASRLFQDLANDWTPSSSNWAATAPESIPALANSASTSAAEADEDELSSS